MLTGFLHHTKAIRFKQDGSTHFSEVPTIRKQEPVPVQKREYTFLENFVDIEA